MDERMRKVKNKSDELSNGKDEPIPSDVLGSYTGRISDPYEVPVQDADDL